MSAGKWVSHIRQDVGSRVWLFSPDPEIRGDPDTVRLSSGSGPASATASNAADFVATAWLPKPPWRRPGRDEEDELWSPSPPPQSRLVSVLRMLDPGELDEVRNAIPSLRRLDGTRPEAWQNPTIRFLLRTISGRCRLEAPIACNGLAENEGGLATVTVNPQLHRFVGLHLDSWDNLPIEDLPSARNRISVNVGEVVRYLLFINLTVADAMALLGGADNIPQSASARDIVLTFLAAHPDYPIARIAIRPGEAYIAPTENVLHDASSEGVSGTSAHVTFRGNFSFASR
jgi:hypothetical protein